MTIRELQEYRFLQSESAALQARIWDLQNPYKSPQMASAGGSHGNTPSNPTQDSAFRIIEEEKKLECMQSEIARRMITIDNWLTTVESADIRTIIHWHYMLGLTWEQTSQKIYGVPSKFICQKKIVRYFKK